MTACHLLSVAHDAFRELGGVLDVGFDHGHILLDIFKDFIVLSCGKGSGRKPSEACHTLVRTSSSLGQPLEQSALRNFLGPFDLLKLAWVRYCQKSEQYFGRFQIWMIETAIEEFLQISSAILQKLCLERPCQLFLWQRRDNGALEAVLQGIV